MLENTGRTEPIEKPSRTAARDPAVATAAGRQGENGADEGQSNGNGGAAAGLH